MYKESIDCLYNLPSFYWQSPLSTIIDHSHETSRTHNSSEIKAQRLIENFLVIRRKLVRLKVNWTISGCGQFYSIAFSC